MNTEMVIMTTSTVSPPSVDAQPPANLSFSRETFAKLSPHPYLLAYLSPPSENDSEIRRPNGRFPTEFRTPHVNTGSLTHAEGSAVVRLGDTTAVCGIRAEILLVSDILNPSSIRGMVPESDATKEMKELDLLVPNIELATGCSPSFLPGQPPSTLAQSLSTRLYSLLHSCGIVDGRDLRIWWTPPAIGNKDEGMDIDDDDAAEGQGDDETKPQIKAFWTLYIDILFISLDGNPFDAAWVACLAALQNLRLPVANWDADKEMVLCEDDMEQARSLELRGCPVGCTFGVFGAANHGQSEDKVKRDGKKQWILADPDTFEEGLCYETVTIVVDCSSKGSEGQSRGQTSQTKILGISKAGGTSIGKCEMRELISLAEKRWREWTEVLSSTAGARENS